MKLTTVQETILRYKVREAYDQRVKKLNEIQARHVEKLVHTSNLSSEHVALLQKLIRGIDEAISNHEGMRDVILSVISN